MRHDMFVEQITLAEKAIRTIMVYYRPMVLFRLTGNRGLAEGEHIRLYRLGLNRLTANSPTGKRLFGDAPRRSETVAAPSRQA